MTVLSLASGGCAMLDRSVELGDGYHHVVMTHPSSPRPARVLHVYVEGDGRPYVAGTAVNADPTPGNPLALSLMLRDPSGGVYVGRPCYYGLAARPECDPSLWTTARYAEKIVDSMAAVIRSQAKGRQVLLIGHSGGGALATLVASRLDNVAGLITVAANLDVGAWTELHGYTPLFLSLNPRDVLASLRQIPQVHFVGGRDSEVPPSLLSVVSADLPEGSICLIPEFDHRCCWRDMWRDTMLALKEQTWTASNLAACARDR